MVSPPPQDLLQDSQRPQSPHLQSRGQGARLQASSCQSGPSHSFPPSLALNFVSRRRSMTPPPHGAEQADQSAQLPQTQSDVRPPKAATSALLREAVAAPTLRLSCARPAGAMVFASERTSRRRGSRARRALSWAPALGRRLEASSLACSTSPPAPTAARTKPLALPAMPSSLVSFAARAAKGKSAVRQVGARWTPHMHGTGPAGKEHGSVGGWVGRRRWVWG
mmetsp:Transcript_6118/g.16630  ORF Transcript_6118/g.16630 Transcript_6118/m.16630 type:complete len:223 (+) Transcript_6118:2391-3059(+)